MNDKMLVILYMFSASYETDGGGGGGGVVCGGGGVGVCGVGWGW